MNITTGHLYISAGDLHLDGDLIHDLGNVAFSGGNFSIDGSNFFIDAVTGYVGIGTNVPNTKLDVNGIITAIGGSSTNWNTAHTHSQNNSQAHSDYLKNNADDSTTGRLTATGFISTIFESATGNLKLQAGAVGDVVLFSSADVGDTDDGKELKIWRNAPEGNNYIRTYITSTQNALTHSNTNILFQNADGKNIQFNSGQHIYLNLGDSAGSDEVRIRDSGGNEVATMDSDGNAWFKGNVGIGVSNPTQPLMIMGNGGNNEVGITQNQVGGTATMEFTTKDLEGNQATRLLLRGTSNTSDVEFYTGGRGGEQVTMFIEGSNGYVGIGTNTPDATLEVVGNITLREQLTFSFGEMIDNIIDGWLRITGNLNVTGNITLLGTVDGRDIATDGTKLDGLEAGAEVSTKEFFLPAGSGILDNNAVHTDDAIVLPDGVTFARAYFNFHLPSDFSSMNSGYPKVVMMPGTGGGGNVRIAFNSQSGGVGEQLGSSIDNIAEYTKAVSSTSNIIIEEDISNAFDGLGLSAGDSVSFYIQRDSDDAGDTFSGGLNVVGVIVKYN